MPVTVDAGGLSRALEDMALHLGERLADRFVETVQRNASRRTGALAESVKADDPVLRGDEVEIHVEVGADYGRYQDEGTGIYGPEGRRIEARPGGVLRFDWPAAGGIVFATSVAGSEPTRFWSKAIADWPLIVRRVSAGG